MVFVALVLGCGFVTKEGLKDQYEETFREQFAKTCAKEVDKPQVCGCLADELVARVPPKKLVGLTLKPKDADVQKIVADVLKTCGGEIVH